MKTVLITGAEGFAGQHVVRLLLEQGFQIVGTVRNRARKLAFEKQYGKALVCDVADAIDVARVVAAVKPDGIIHLAGASRPEQAEEEPLAAYQSIVAGYANVLDAVRRVTPRARVVLASSCEVYGSSGRDGAPLSETSRLAPVSTFGALKLTAESIAHTFFDHYHLNICVARPFHAIGPDQPASTFYGWVAQQVIGAADTQPARLAAPDLDVRRDVLHVTDQARAYLALLESGAPNTTYNICSGESRTVREIVQTIIRASGNLVDVVAAAEQGEPRTPALIGNPSRLQELSWRPTRSFEQAVTDLVRSYQAAPAAAQRPTSALK